jgi:hypothetical protein
VDGKLKSVPLWHFEWPHRQHKAATMSKMGPKKMPEMGIFELPVTGGGITGKNLKP